jgi:hypothetical protein
MAATTRQTNLLIQQDWKKVYQSFQNADFQSYDFETLRKSMIDYLRTYYPEDFNDFLESSEYVALIDLIAFLGQSLAFRTDLNARENFLDTAERRDSVLKLARLISYNPKRNIGSSGLLKFDSVSTSENVFDSNGLNLSNISVFWNDPGNDNWQEQFAIILNAAMIDSQVVGKPGNTKTIAGARTEEYSANLLPNIIPAFKFQQNIEGTAMNFEVVSATSVDQEYLYEKDPNPSKIFNFLYRNDNLGNNSNNTGWFVYFKQGDINTIDFTITDSLPNRIVSINVDNINNNDIWLFKLNSSGTPGDKWSEVPNVAGFNVIYNTSIERNIFQVNTRANDQIDLVFGDGAFANIPIGTYRLFYRTSNGFNYKINPEEMQNVSIPVTYVSRNGRAETLTIKASLHYTVNNANTRETLEEIKTKAPQQYYTQNRMVTGEDYNILPFTKFSNILKIKATNRNSSGVSRYLDTIDVTGKYSSTNIFGEDGVLYKQETIEAQEYVPPTSGDVVSSLNEVINNSLLVDNFVPFSQLIYEKLPRYTTRDATVNGTIFDAAWTQLTTGTNQSTGFFATSTNYNSATLTGTFATPLKTGEASSNAMRFIQKGAIIKFKAAAEILGNPKYFDKANDIQAGAPNKTGDRLYIYATVVKITGDGTNGGIIKNNVEGPITLSTFIPDGACIEEIIPKFYNVIPIDVLRTTATLTNGRKNFGLRFDQLKQTWAVIQPQNLKLTQTLSTLLGNGIVNSEYNGNTAGDITASSLDSSWLIAFVSGPYGYKIYYRQVNYIFESKRETKFYFDPKVRVYDPKSAQVISDQIKILRSNSSADSTGPIYDDKIYFIYKMIIDPDGFENTSKILLQFPDSNRDGVPDNPDLFEEIVAPNVNVQNKKIFFEKSYNSNNYIQYTIINEGIVETAFASQTDIVAVYNQYDNGQIFYAYGENLFYTLVVAIVQGIETRTLVSSANGETYLLLPGRQDLYFQYRHTSPANRRIDPSPNNIIDLFVLTKQYAASYQSWIQDTSGKIVQPLLPTTEDLQLEFSELESYKAISDSLIYSSARFKPLFGAKADPVLRATFKVVKNTNVVISDNDIKVAVVSAINKYFDITNWDFGETFFFSELSAYLHSVLTPKISSIIIVPTSTGLSFGNLYQINAEPDEIVASAATVDNVEIISAITAAQLL